MSLDKSHNNSSDPWIVTPPVRDFMKDVGTIIWASQDPKIPSARNNDWYAAYMKQVIATSERTSQNISAALRSN